MGSNRHADVLNGDQIACAGPGASWSLPGKQAALAAASAPLPLQPHAPTGPLHHPAWQAVFGVDMAAASGQPLQSISTRVLVEVVGQGGAGSGTPAATGEAHKATLRFVPVEVAAAEVAVGQASRLVAELWRCRGLKNALKGHEVRGLRRVRPGTVALVVERLQGGSDEDGGSEVRGDLGGAAGWRWGVDVVR